MLAHRWSSDTGSLYINPLTTNNDLVVIEFGRMLSVGAIRFARRDGEVGGYTALPDSAWWRLQLPVQKPWSMVAVAAACQKPWSMPGGPFVCFLAQTGIENAPFIL